MKAGKKETAAMEADAIKCHEDYIRRTSKHPERDIGAFRRQVRFCKRLRKNYSIRG